MQLENEIKKTPKKTNAEYSLLHQLRCEILYDFDLY